MFVPVWALMTLSSFCISPAREERLALCSWSLLCHVLYMHYVIAIVFGNHADSIPRVVLYLRDSLAMALASLLVAVIGRRCSLKTSAPPGLLVAAVGRLRPRAAPSCKVAHTRLASGHQDGDDQDSCQLVETPARPSAVTWGQVVRLVDLLLLVVFAGLHFVFWLALLA